MKGDSSWSGPSVLVVAGLILLLSGCLVVADQGQEERCYTDCYEYEVCQGFCDAWSCWDQCWWESTCDTVCDSDHQQSRPSWEPGVGCYSDVECSEGRICINNQCHAADTDQRGVGGLCQVCESERDCMEEGALCIRLNFDEVSQTGEQICGRTCEYDHDCPIGFTCFNISEEVGVSAQCLPDSSAEGVRTCNASAELECVRANDCAVGESCVNNSCQGPDGSECSQDHHCGQDQRCQQFSCVDESTPQCLERSDCQSNELCIDGDCIVHAQSCILNEDCDEDARCVDGQCAATCMDSEQCGYNERCRQGLCEYIECRRSADCTAGEICVEASCVDSCNDTSQCAAGFRCSELQYCEPDPEVECRSTAECAYNELCNGSGVCERPCHCNQQCGSGEVCNEEVGVCEEPASEQEFTNCEDDCECPGGMSCEEGQCQQ